MRASLFLMFSFLVTGSYLELAVERRDDFNSPDGSGALPSRGAKILDLTSRLPYRPPPPEPAPPPPPRRRSSPFFLVFPFTILLGLVLGIWVGAEWQRRASREYAEQLMGTLSQPSELELLWPEADNRPLRLMGLSETRRVGDEPPPRLSLAYERVAELWLLDASARDSDPMALRALASLYAKLAPPSRFLLLSKSELETFLARHGPIAPVLNDLAVVSALLGQMGESQQYLEQGLALSPNSPVLLYNAAQVARAEGPASFAREREYLKRFLAVDQGSPWRAAMEQRAEDVSHFGTHFNSGQDPR